MYVCTYVTYVCICTHVCTYVHTYICACTYTQTHIQRGKGHCQHSTYSMYVCHIMCALTQTAYMTDYTVHTYVHVTTCVGTYVRKYAHTYVYVCTYIVFAYENAWEFTVQTLHICILHIITSRIKNTQILNTYERELLSRIGCMYVCTYIRTYVHTYMQRQTCPYVCMYVHVHKCMNVQCPSKKILPYRLHTQVTNH